MYWTQPGTLSCSTMMPPVKGLQTRNFLLKMGSLLHGLFVGASFYTIQLKTWVSWVMMGSALYSMLMIVSLWPLSKLPSSSSWLGCSFWFIITSSLSRGVWGAGSVSTSGLACSSGLSSAPACSSLPPGWKISISWTLPPSSLPSVPAPHPL